MNSHAQPEGFKGGCVDFADEECGRYGRESKTDSKERCRKREEGEKGGVERVRTNANKIKVRPQKNCERAARKKIVRSDWDKKDSSGAS